MPGGKGNIKGTDGNTFSSTNQPKNRGRKKLTTTKAKEAGYSAEEVRRVMAYALTLTRAEMEERIKDPKADALEILLIRSLMKAGAKGVYAFAKEIIDHVAGRPMSKSEVNLQNDGGAFETNIIIPDNNRD